MRQLPRRTLLAYPLAHAAAVAAPRFDVSRFDRARVVSEAGQDHGKVEAVELYDHQSDPQENQNIANAPANADLVNRMMAQWKQGWQAAKPRHHRKRIA